ncbi:hypothetical protein RLOC_00000234 [Lonchura striata]|uniref:Uncharacterized protein n=1 Tax=Lonchura striata TaxID=40157 RepID=A0A218UE34_9PASE|nr:hypothetical protein RLOC_00000234 [Lonchura striata domestica]
MGQGEASSSSMEEAGYSEALIPMKRCAATSPGRVTQWLCLCSTAWPPSTNTPLRTKTV